MKMKNINFIVASFFGTTSVALGALGAHFLKSKIEDGLISSDQLSAFDTATKYQLIHALLLFVIAQIQNDNNAKWLNLAKYCFIIGILFFSFSIYFLTTKNITGFYNISFLGPITPLGGVLLITGWVFLGIYGLKKNNI